MGRTLGISYLTTLHDPTKYLSPRSLLQLFRKSQTKLNKVTKMLQWKFQDAEETVFAKTNIQVNPNKDFKLNQTVFKYNL